MKPGIFGKRTKGSSVCGPSIYGMDPGDASVEHALGVLLDEIRQDADQLRRYPNAGTAGKALMLAEQLAPGRGWRRLALTLAILLTGASRNQWRPPGRDRRRKRQGGETP